MRKLNNIKVVKVLLSLLFIAITAGGLILLKYCNDIGGAISFYVSTIAFSLLCYTIFFVGNSERKYTNLFVWLDNIYTDILFFLYFISMILVGNLFQSINRSYLYNMLYKYGMIISISVPVIIAMGMLGGCSFVYMVSILRKFRTGNFIKHTFIYQSAMHISGAIRSVYQHYFDEDEDSNDEPFDNLNFRQSLLIILTIIIMIAIVILSTQKSYWIFMLLLMEFSLLWWFINGNNLIYKHLDEEFEEALSKQLQSERMKIALVTNVSHDLKTPLTSIISYIDLLGKEEGLTETATDYISILQKKSDRLKNIVTDLFELAKSTSGNINIEEELIDLKKLTEQTLADLDDKIVEQGIQFKITLPDESVVIKSDGKKLYRVFQNIIDNALKYSLKNTRVYIDLDRTEEEAIFSVKNISSYEMNFTEDEILQRFYRGDQSRSTEGSGLGLSIAESFTKNCGGKLEVAIDGDVFKVILTFPVI